MFSSITDLYPLHMHSNLKSYQSKMLPTSAIHSLRGKTISLVKNHGCNWCEVPAMLGTLSTVPGDIRKASQTMWLSFQGWARICSEGPNNLLPRNKFKGRSHSWEHSGSILAILGAINYPNCTGTVHPPRFSFSIITHSGHVTHWKTVWCNK